MYSSTREALGGPVPSPKPTSSSLPSRHRRRRTIGPIEFSPSTSSSAAGAGADAADRHLRDCESHSPLSSLSAPFELSDASHANITTTTATGRGSSSSSSPHRSRVRSRAQRPSFSSESCSEPPRSPSHKIAQRLASPPTSPIGLRSGLSRILTLQEDSEEPARLGVANCNRSSRIANIDPIVTVSFSEVSRRSGALGAPPPSSSHHQLSHHRHASNSASVDTTKILSCSTSLRSDRADRYRHEPRHGRHRTVGSSKELPLAAGSSPTRERDWSTRARRWSSSMSRRMSISAINETISSTTSPYLKAGLDELRSIFDVDSIGVYDEVEGRYRISAGDLEECSLAIDDSSSAEYEDDASRRGQGTSANSLGLRGCNGTPGVFQFPRRPTLEAMFDSPENLSGHSSQSLSRQTTVVGRSPFSPAAQRRAGDSGAGASGETCEASTKSAERKRTRSTERSDGHDAAGMPSLGLASEKHRFQAFCAASRQRASHNGNKLSSPAATAVGLAAVAVGILALCSLEATIHPDAASLPLMAFMLAQPIFAAAGLLGLLLQRRWLMDLSSRLLRAHVLCQVLIALAALRNLSSTAIYRHPRASAPASALVGERLPARLRFARSDVEEDLGRSPSVFNSATTPHQSNVGSLQDQVTYILIFFVQAAVPLLAALWVQYGIAMKLSLLATLSSGSGSSVSPFLSTKSLNEERPSRKRSTHRSEGSRRAEPAEKPTNAVAHHHPQTASVGQRNEQPLKDRLEPAATLNFKLDPADLSSRLEGVVRETMQAEREGQANPMAEAIATTA